MDFKKMLVASAAAILLIGFISIYGTNYNNVELAYTPDNLLRLHVIGNSNSLDDQIDKLLVRDLVLQQVQDLFFGVEDRAEALSRLTKYKANLAFMVSQSLRTYGKEHNISATIGMENFPATEYGNLKLPAGPYSALKIVVGNGEGKNWWCVLFPPLCFVDAAKLSDKAIKREYRFFIWDFIKDFFKIKSENIDFDPENTAIKEDKDLINLI